MLVRAGEIVSFARKIVRMVGIAAALWGCVFQLPVKAGAWLEAEGRGQVIFSSSMMLADQRFDAKGKPRGADRFIKQESRTTLSYGLLPDVTVIGIVGGVSQSTTTYDGTLENRSFAPGGGVRARLWSNADSVISVQASGEGRYERVLGEVYTRLEPRAQAEARILAGHNFTFAGWSLMGEAQAGWRWRGSGFANEAMLDLTLGIRAHPSVQILLQSFNTVALAREAGAVKARQHKMQLSAAIDITRAITAQFGVFTSLQGQSSLREQGGVLALWRKF
jgi:protein XagA